ncbi:hypothetical protein ACQPZZ_26060 [Microbispora sp. CA-135349]|uniref:hypothetical protein n=1 Tax=Microbispora sp. CA-135349 TaxID=3239953 RepID=UPI003D8FEA66
MGVPALWRFGTPMEIASLPTQRDRSPGEGPAAAYKRLLDAVTRHRHHQANWWRWPTGYDGQTRMPGYLGAWLARRDQADGGVRSHIPTRTWLTAGSDGVDRILQTMTALLQAQDDPLARLLVLDPVACHTAVSLVLLAERPHNAERVIRHLLDVSALNDVRSDIAGEIVTLSFYKNAARRSSAIRDLCVRVLPQSNLGEELTAEIGKLPQPPASSPCATAPGRDSAGASGSPMDTSGSSFFSRGAKSPHLGLFRSAHHAHRVAKPTEEGKQRVRNTGTAEQKAPDSERGTADFRDDAQRHPPVPPLAQLTTPCAMTKARSLLSFTPAALATTCDYRSRRTAAADNAIVAKALAFIVFTLICLVVAAVH